jgi:hypothetical protein
MQIWDSNQQRMKHFTANSAQPQTSAVMNSFAYDIKKLAT